MNANVDRAWILFDNLLYAFDNLSSFRVFFFLLFCRCGSWMLRLVLQVIFFEKKIIVLVHVLL